MLFALGFFARREGKVVLVHCGHFLHISFSLPHLIHFCDGLRMEEPHFTDVSQCLCKMSWWFICRDFELLLGACGGDEGRQGEPSMFFVVAFQLYLV